MKVSELAKDLNITSEDVLKALRSLKLKAKDSEQVLSAAVVSVIKSELQPAQEAPVKKPAKSDNAKKTAKKKTAATTKKKEAKETATEKKAEKPKTTTVAKAKKATTATKKKTVEVKDAKTKPTAKKVVSRPVRTTEKGMTVKKKTTVKKTTVKDASKTHPKISMAPVITLKPLARKRKKPAPTAKGEPVSDVKDEIKTGLMQAAPEAVDKDLIPVKEVVQEIPRDESLPDIEVQVPITVKDLSVKLQEKPSIVLKHLMKMGIFCHINQSLEADIVSRIVRDFGFNLAKIRTQEQQLIETHKQEEEDESPRISTGVDGPPVLIERPWSSNIARIFP